MSNNVTLCPYANTYAFQVQGCVRMISEHGSTKISISFCTVCTHASIVVMYGYGCLPSIHYHSCFSLPCTLLHNHFVQQGIESYTNRSSKKSEMPSLIRFAIGIVDSSTDVCRHHQRFNLLLYWLFCMVRVRVPCCVQH
jgi:uncharacterized protein with PQ loop repeat